MNDVGQAKATAASPGSAGAPVPPQRRRRLAIRLAWLTVLAILLAEAMFLVPSLVRSRQNWLERRLTEAQLAALSAIAAPGGTVDPRMRDDLLRLASAEAIVLEMPGHARIVLSRDGPFPPSTRLALRSESFWAGLTGTATALFDDVDGLVSVEGPSPVRQRAEVATVVRRQDLHDALARQLRRTGSISLLIAVAVGLLLYLALLQTLVRPMRQLTASIAAFRADPEHATPLDATGFGRSGEDEIAAAASELATMQRELRAALWRNARLAALGTAVAKVNHDLRGVLSPAMLTAERLQMSDDPTAKRSGDLLVRTIERATELTRRMLEFAREAPVTPAKQIVPLRPAVEEAAEQAFAISRTFRVEDRVAPEIVVDADRESLLRVLGNLMRNAAEAGARNVAVTANPEGDEMVITVADDGPGLPETVRAALFRPFVAGGRRGGTGLGLAIVRDLIRAQGGEVTLLDTGPNGTRFRVTLPHRRYHPKASAA